MLLNFRVYLTQNRVCKSQEVSQIKHVHLSLSRLLKNEARVPYNELQFQN